MGDSVTILPSGEKAGVTSILRGDKEAERASKDMPVTISLNKEVDVSRGCVLTKDTELKVNNMFTSTILWMDDEALVPGKNFIIKGGTRLLPATIRYLKYKIDINSGGGWSIFRPESFIKMR